jgi:drug/metabolite transporter (DMT)-like permease
MRLLRLIEFLRARLKTVIYVSCGILALVALIDVFVDKHHAHTKVEHLPAFWSVFGFLACVVIVIASKAFGKAGIMTREDYYDE